MHDVVNKIVLYRQMVELIDTYSNSLFEGSEWDDKVFQRFQSEWDDCKRKIELINDTDGDIELERELLMELICKHQTFMNRVESRFNIIKDQMMGVKQNQTVVNAYYHRSKYNDVSYYFDEKQ